MILRVDRKRSKTLVRPRLGATSAHRLGDALIDEVLAATDRAARNPDLFRIVRARGEVRRALTDRFPYRIFFSVISETLYVHAVLHGAQHDRRWRERL